ncbi:non-specific lipid-transfer protein 1-like [Tasmannia lanceolata]|uniref:non-specific lipid-transfer protein 1-like n=1 Tax=Tasmannia lanceolata TaxID=3420 RepID=UPI004063B567
MVGSRVHTLSSCLMLVCILLSSSYAEAALSCGTVIGKLTPCLNYLRMGGAVPPACCTGVQGLNAVAKTTPDRQTACGCMKSAAAGISGLQLPFAASLPGKCGVNIPYKISPTTDCTTVK